MLFRSFHLAQNDLAEYQSAAISILMRKASLLERAINRLFAEPHYLSGWLALNQRHFIISAEGVEWLSNPIRVLADLYHYLNMDARDGLPALYAIWDHDDELLQEAIDFYDALESKLDISDWKALNRALHPQRATDLLCAPLS